MSGQWGSNTFIDGADVLVNSLSQGFNGFAHIYFVTCTLCSIYYPRSLAVYKISNHIIPRINWICKESFCMHKFTKRAGAAWE